MKEFMMCIGAITSKKVHRSTMQWYVPYLLCSGNMYSEFIRSKSCWLEKFLKLINISWRYIKWVKKGAKSIPDNNLLNNNVNTVVEYQMHRLILSCFLGIPSEFLRNSLETDDSIKRCIWYSTTVFLQFLMIFDDEIYVWIMPFGQVVKWCNFRWILNILFL